MADQLARYSVPGLDPSRPAINDGLYLVEDPRSGFPGGYVRTRMSADGLRVVNRTLPFHVFYDGQIERVATQAPNGAWNVTTRGVGNNVLSDAAIIGEEQGPSRFGRLDRMLKANIERHHGVGGSKSWISTGVGWPPNDAVRGGSAPHAQ